MWFNVFIVMYKEQSIWFSMYLGGYSENFKNFHSFIMDVRPKYNKSSKRLMKDVSKKFIDFFDETICLLKYFINSNNLLLLCDTRLIVIYILKCNILKNGILFYDIYLEMVKLKKRKKYISSKYLSDQYMDVFVQFNEFLKKRIELESCYEFYN